MKVVIESHSEILTSAIYSYRISTFNHAVWLSNLEIEMDIEELEELLAEAERLSLIADGKGWTDVDIENLDKSVEEIVRQSTTFDHAYAALLWSGEKTEGERMALLKALEFATTDDLKDRLAGLILMCSLCSWVDEASTFKQEFTLNVARDPSITNSLWVIKEALAQSQVVRGPSEEDCTKAVALLIIRGRQIAEKICSQDEFEQWLVTYGYMKVD